MKPRLRLLLFGPVLCASIIATLPQITQAAVFERDWKTPGDGLLTYDDVNQREWLDLTESQLFKFPGNALEERYQAVLAETAIDGLFEGFSVAASEEVRSLAESAGIDTSTTDFHENNIKSVGLIDSLGQTSEDVPVSSGVVVDLGRKNYTVLIGAVVGRSNAIAGWIVGDFTSRFSGVWLYRQIPEPSSILLAGAAIILLWSSRHRSRF